MKEFVFVEFLFLEDEYSAEIDKLNKLGSDFEFIKSDYEYETGDDLNTHLEDYVRVSGRINSEAATMIKLKNPVLAEKMRISYISDELKNKYRK